MSVFDLFRGFFGVPGGHYRGRRDPFFDTLTHDEEDEDDEEEEEDGFRYEGFRGDQQDPFDSAWRFGFSLGPDGVRVEEAPVFGQVLREMEEIFSQLGAWEQQARFGQHGVPSLLPTPPQERGEKSPDRRSGNPLRDFMLKSPERGVQGPPSDDHPPSNQSPESHGSPFRGWTPFPKFNDVWSQEPRRSPQEEVREDKDLDSAVRSGGLDQILTPPAGPTPDQPRTRSFFQSVTVTKVVKPDGTVEERRTVRDGRGNEETTVTHSGGPGTLREPDHPTSPGRPGAPHRFSDMRDDDSLFSKFFGGFK